MQLDQHITRPLDEMRDAVSNKLLETAVALQDTIRILRDEQILPEQGSVPGKVLEPLCVHPPLTFPPWPTSQPGPKITAPSPGQRLVPGRCDQVMYDCYDQERGQPGITPPVPADQEMASTEESAETRQTAGTAAQADIQLPGLLPLSEQVTVGQQVYDTQGVRVGKVTVRFPLYLLIERGWIFPRVSYVPLSLVAHVKGPSLWLSVSEAMLKTEDCAQVPLEINDTPAPPASEDRTNISDVSSLSLAPLTPAETGHYHYGPRGPGINTDAGGSYTQTEIDPRGRLRDRPVKLYITGQRVYSRDGNGSEARIVSRKILPGGKILGKKGTRPFSRSF